MRPRPMRLLRRYHADYEADRAASGDIEVRRTVSHERLLASAGDLVSRISGRPQEDQPTPSAVHYRSLSAILKPHRNAGHRVSQTVVRAVHAISTADTEVITNTGHMHRMEKAADAERSPEDRAEAAVMMKQPPVQFVELVASLTSVAPAQQVAHAPDAYVPSTGRHLEADSPASAMVLADAVRVSDAAAQEIASGSPGAHVDALRFAARRYLDATSLAPADAAEAPRRLLARDVADVDAAETADAAASAPHVLFGVSPTAHLSQSQFDVPPEFEGVDEGTQQPGFKNLRDGEVEEDQDEADALTDFLHCVESAEELEGGRQVAARCVVDFVGQARDSTAIMELVAGALDPEALEDLRDEFPHCAAALLAVASAVGDARSQEAMAKLLLSIKERTPEVKSFVGAHDFFYVVNAISELVDPLPVVFDAVHASLALHEDHHDQYHQLLLALGTLGATQARDHPLQDAARRALEQRFDDAVEANKAIEAQFAVHVASAHEEFQAMSEEERHVWLAHTNHVDRREWEETWNTATSQDRALYLEHTLEVIARIHASDAGEHDGYGVHADYSTPPRRLAPNAPRTGGRGGREAFARAVPGSEGHSAALHAVLTAQAMELRYAVQALANLGHPASGPRIQSLTTHRKLSVRAFAVHALHRVPSPEARRILLDVVTNPLEDTTLRSSAVDALGEWPTAHLHGDSADAANNDIVDAALRHFSENDGVDWGDCVVDCSSQCLRRSMAHCHRTCARRCGGEAQIETSLATLLHARWHIRMPDMPTDDAVESHVRRLSAVDAEGDDYESHYRVVGARRLFSILSVLEDIFRYTKFDYVRLPWQHCALRLACVWSVLVTVACLGPHHVVCMFVSIVAADWLPARLETQCWQEVHRIGSCGVDALRVCVAPPSHKSLAFQAFVGAGLKNILDININLFCTFVFAQRACRDGHALSDAALLARSWLL